MPIGRALFQHFNLFGKHLPVLFTINTSCCYKWKNQSKHQRMNADAADSKENASMKHSPSKQKEYFVENVLDDIMGEDLNFEDFDDEVDQKHLQHSNEKTRKITNNNVQKKALEEGIPQRDKEQTKSVSSSMEKESSNQMRSLTSLENERTSPTKAKHNIKDDNKSLQSSRSVASSKERPIRYFVIKSNNFEHLEISTQKSIWSTQPHNEQKLNEAFEVPALA